MSTTIQFEPRCSLWTDDADETIVVQDEDRWLDTEGSNSALLQVVSERWTGSSKVKLSIEGALDKEGAWQEIKTYLEQPAEALLLSRDYPFGNSGRLYPFIRWSVKFVSDECEIDFAINVRLN